MTSNSGLKAKIHERQAVSGETYARARNAVAARPSFPTLEVGQRIRFEGDRTSMTVRAQSKDRRYVILTRPFPLRKTVLYSIVDFTSGIRGTGNLVFGWYGYETDADIRENLALLEEGEMEVSHRRWVWLRYTDSQPDTRTQGIIGLLREITRHAPARGYNDHNPRTEAELLA